MKSEPVAAVPPKRRPWALILASVLGIAWAGVARFDGRSRALPLDEAIRTLVSCHSDNERELALAVVGTRARELVTILAIAERHEGRTGRYAGVYLDQMAEALKKERDR